MSRSILLSILAVALIYIVMSSAIAGLVPWREAARTALILFGAAASLYALILGYSPHVALLTIGAVSLPFSFFSLGQLVNWLVPVQILTIFVWQCAGLLLRRDRSDLRQLFTMWLYPEPALVALVMRVYAPRRARPRALRSRRAFCSDRASRCISFRATPQAAATIVFALSRPAEGSGRSRLVRQAPTGIRRDSHRHHRGCTSINLPDVRANRSRHSSRSGTCSTTRRMIASDSS